MTFSSPLEPRDLDRSALFRGVSDAIGDQLDGVATRPVAPTVSTEEIRARLSAYEFDRPVAPERAVADVLELLSDGIVQVGHPRYFGLFNPRPAPMAVLADALVAAFNPQLAVHSHAPAAVEIERHLLRFIGARLGFDRDLVAGSFCAGGAEANLTGVLLALTRKFPEVARGGVRTLGGQPLLYVSEEGHHSFFKVAGVAGLGRDAIRLVPADGDLRIDVAALREIVAEDRAAGHLPFLAIATAGATSTGVIDPLADVADACSEEGLHLHVDAAWAGALCLSDRLRPLLEGIERADSATIDAHKWLSTPMAGGMFLCTDEQGLIDTFPTVTAYMPGADAAADPYLHSLQWSRRFIGLKLFLPLAVAGTDGYARQLEHDLEIGDHLRATLAGRDWEIVNRSPLPVVCFVDPRLASTDERRSAATHSVIAESVVRSGRCWISPTRVGGRAALRACITNYVTGPDDVEALADALDAARAQTIG
jgi:aromatic-L-amino-acid/L-tryptophan decarboxylase